MCGIFGIVTDNGPLPEGSLQRAAQSLAHRGPDDSGTLTLHGIGQTIGLAHARLSIIDLSPLGHQPMQDPLTGNWIVFNGEIYNFRDLRRELESKGDSFRSQSDTEVILAAYRNWGEECFSRLRGMFALALWDRAQEKLLLARDPMGIKPLYYWQSGKQFLFASEVRTLLQTGLMPRKMDGIGLLSYLAFGSVCEPWSIIEGVAPVPAGHVLTVQKGTVSRREYWNPIRPAAGSPPQGKPSPDSEATQELPKILRDAVLSHLVSDVPVGVFLSGGIDSSSLVAVLSHNGVRANTFSLVFSEEEFSEAQYSREVARRFATEHHEIPVSQGDTLAVLPEALRAMDQPTMDGINTYLVSAKTRAAGVKVALTGLGADEMFAGYSNFRRVPQMERFLARWNRLPSFARQLLATRMRFVFGKSDRARKLAELASFNDGSVHPYFLLRMLFGLAERKALFAAAEYEAAERAIGERTRYSVAESSALDPVNRVSYLESFWYMRNTLLRDSDFMSMAHGLELRVPFLDRALVETCFRIAGTKKLEGKLPKNLLLSNLGVDLPAEIVKRPKRGFTLPFERWLRGEMRPVVEKALFAGDADQASLDPIGVRQVWARFLAGETSWSRPWSLFVLKRWCQQNL